MSDDLTADRIQGDVLAAIRNSEYDFRTTESLTREFKVNRLLMVGVLDNLWREGKIRHPFGWERHLYGVAAHLDLEPPRFQYPHGYVPLSGNG